MRSLTHRRKPVEFDGIRTTLAKLVEFDRFNRIGFEAVYVKREPLELDAVMRRKLERVGYGE